MVADDLNNKIRQKTFHSEILNDHGALQTESNSYKELPVITKVATQMVNENFRNIKTEISGLIEIEIERTLNTLGLDRVKK